MGRRAGVPLLLFLILAALVVTLTAAFLGFGSLLARLFAVSVWEATLVTLIVAGGLLWLLTYLTGPAWLFPAWPAAVEDEPDDDVIIEGPVRPTASARRGGRRRR